MRVELVNIKGNWNEVVNRARTTVNKTKIDKEPSDAFKRKILMAEHSPIRGLIFCFKITNLSRMETDINRLKVVLAEKKKFDILSETQLIR